VSRNRSVAAAASGLAAAALALLLAHTASAGDWQPDANRRYTFEIGAGPAATIGERERRWARSLVANLERPGGTVAAFDLFPRQPAAGC
jgi:hypothetical protein